MKLVGPILRLLVGCVSVVGVFAVGTFILLVIAVSSLIHPTVQFNRFASVYMLLSFAIPAGVSLGIYNWLKRRGWFALPWLSTKWLKAFRMIVIAGYVFTVTFGIPAVQTHADDWAVSEHVGITTRRLLYEAKNLQEISEHPEWLEYHPYIATYMALPVLPGVIVTYHEYQLESQYDFGGFEASLWYGWGVRDLFRIPIWLS